ncbi:acyl-CoA dehydrogenase family protein [Nocardia sp. CA-135953]|uniref:acyl-CoA dehydrogenase family protein n=1 Tax=Nocardia sp. CA-135953 TaxID=3239978 RepID=UPI003D97AD3D
MPTLTRDERDAFVESVDGELRRLWPSATAAGGDPDTALTELWSVAAAQGWTGLAADGAIDATIAAVTRLGRMACVLPLVDANVALELFGTDPVGEQIVNGVIRPVVAAAAVDATVVRSVDAAVAATHVLLVDGDRAVLRPIATRTPTVGLALPSWSEVTLAPEVTAESTVGVDPVERAKQLVRLGLAARAVGAAERAWELSLAHAKERVAFGKPIGSFQAVSHRAADGATDITAARHLIEEAVAALQAGRSDSGLACELAVAFAGPAAIRTQFGAQHTLAASGYFEEHEAPWLFRRVNADICRLDAFPLAAGEVADVLIETGARLPALELGEDAEAFRAEVRKFLGEYGNDVAVRHIGDPAGAVIIEGARDHGYLTLAWPQEYGGAEASVERQTVLGEEFSYARAPLTGKAAIDLLGTAVIRHGTDEQKKRLLPLIGRGDFPFYLGYSEPETGSDLAALRTRAVRDGDEWIVDGRKMWGTGAHTAEWVWLAARTDPAASPPHAGITVFLTRVDRPGFEVQQHRALSGEISCSTFFDGFRIPDSDRIGEVNGGWKVITTALAQERVLMANVAADIRRLLDDMLDEIAKDPDGIVGGRGSAKRALITELAARLQAARVLVDVSIRATSAGAGVRLEAPMAKIIASLLHEDFSEAALRIFGPAAALGETVTDVPGRGAFEYNLRFSIMQVVGGGTIDIQRNLVARSLGLPR